MPAAATVKTRVHFILLLLPLFFVPIADRNTNVFS
jgi:hypothetical protein